MSILHRLAKWILRHETSEYLKGWQDGVEQHMYDPESCHPVSRGRWLTEHEYWFGEGAEE